MPNSKALFQALVDKIHLPEDKGEIQSIVYLILEHELGVKKSDIMMGKEVAVLNIESLDRIVQRVNAHEPIQYILGESDFFGRKFIVNPWVLIPRSETEGLISEIIKFNFPPHLKVLDIGTGSGCIAITLSLEILQSKIIATDISQEALEVARQNANLLKADVELLKHNILTENLPTDAFDLIVSNPPYISKEEKMSMNKNVLDHEPHLALFSENDPLQFYRQIAQKARTSLKRNGKVVVEINEHFGKESYNIFQAAGFSRCELLKDMQNKDRILIAQ